MAKRKKVDKRSQPKRDGTPVVKTPTLPEHPSLVGRVLINRQRRVGLVTSDCAAWTRMLRIGSDCIIDIVRADAEELVNDGWHPMEGCEHAALKLANTFACSPLTKTPAAARAIVEVQAAGIGALTLEQLTEECRRLRPDGASPGFATKTAALKALVHITAVRNTEEPQQQDAKAAGARLAAQHKENDMAAKKTAKVKGKTAKTKASKAAAKKTAAPAKKTTAKKAAVPVKKGTGIGALIRELIGKGRENQEIVDTVLQKFPGAKTNAANVSWYRSAMKKGG